MWLIDWIIVREQSSSRIFTVPKMWIFWEKFWDFLENYEIIINVNKNNKILYNINKKSKSLHNKVHKLVYINT